MPWPSGVSAVPRGNHRSIKADLRRSSRARQDGIYKHPQMKKWLAARPRYHVHFTPTSSSWMNQVERRFAEITHRRTRRGTFRSVRELTKAIHQYIRIYNNDRRPLHASPAPPKSSARSTNIHKTQKHYTSDPTSIILGKILAAFKLRNRTACVCSQFASEGQ